MISYISLFLFDLFHLVWLCLGPFILLQRALFHSFLWLIFNYVYIHTLYVPCLLYAFICQTFRLLLDLGYFVNSVAMNTGVHVCFWIRDFCGCMLRNGFMYHMAALCLVFYGTSILFSIVASPIYIPVNVWEGSLFSTPSPAFAICRLFDDVRSDWCEVIPHCSFDLHFSNSDIEHLFMRPSRFWSC